MSSLASAESIGQFITGSRRAGMMNGEQEELRASGKLKRSVFSVPGKLC